MENKKFENSSLPVAPKPAERWGYESYFKEYLLLLASKGHLALEKTGMFPERIELGKTWHEVLNHMRKSTLADGKEKWAFAGAKAEKRGIFLPTVPITGANDHVSPETMKKMMGWARDKAGIVDFLGDIHSHPTDLAESLSQKIVSLVSGRHDLVEAFSAGDFYSLIARTETYFMGVVAGDYNIFAFKAKESLGLGVNPILFSQDSFEKYWYEEFGYKYLGSVEKYGALRAIPISPTANQTEINIAIAQKHNLLIYQGKANKDLVRIFPR